MKFLIRTLNIMASILEINAVMGGYVRLHDENVHFDALVQQPYRYTNTSTLSHSTHNHRLLVIHQSRN